MTQQSNNFRPQNETIDEESNEENKSSSHASNSEYKRNLK